MPQTFPPYNSPIAPSPVTPLPDPNRLTSEMNTIVNRALPGFNNLTSSASSIVGNLMKGNPSSSPVRRANAYFGVSSGMPSSDFVRNRGYDLYGEKADQYQQRGFDDFLKLLTGYSGTVLPTVGQQQAGGEFAQNLQQRQIENNQANEKFNAQFNKPGADSGKIWSSDSKGNLYGRNGSRVGFDPNFVSPEKIAW